MPRAMTGDERNSIRNTLKQVAEQRESVAIGKRVRWKEEVDELTKKIAIGALGIEKELVELDKLQSKMSGLQEQIDVLEVSIEKKLPVKERQSRYDDACEMRMTICEAIEKLKKDALSEAMKMHVVGAKVSSIREELETRLLNLQKCTTREEVAALGILDWE